MAEIKGNIGATGEIKGTINLGGETDNLPAVMFGQKKAVTVPGNATFFGTKFVEEVTLPNAQHIGLNGFSRWPALKKVTAPEVLTVKDEAFYESKKLTEVTLPKCTDVGERAFYGAFEVGASLSLPNCTTIREGAFIFSGLKTLDCPKVTTVWKKIIQDSQIESISLPSVKNLPDNALESARNCKNIEIPECVYLGHSCLASCAFSSIRLPKVNTIGSEQFTGNRNIRDIYLGYESVVSVLKSPMRDSYRLFNEYWLRGQTVTIHVPADQLDNYRADAAWSAIVAEEAENQTTIVFAGDYNG